MSFWTKLFSFKGRIGRADWWTLSTLIFVVQLAVFLLVFQANGGLPEVNPTLDGSGKPAGKIAEGAGVGGLAAAIVLAGLVGVWPTWAVGVKRWHDRDKGAAWMLVNLIPYVGWLWATVECGFLGGTPGPNRFGAGPGSRESIADAFGDEADDDDGRAEAAVARWRSEQQARLAPAATPQRSVASTYALAPASPVFGKRGSAPAGW